MMENISQPVPLNECIKFVEGFKSPGFSPSAAFYQMQMSILHYLKELRTKYESDDV